MGPSIQRLRYFVTSMEASLFTGIESHQGHTRVGKALQEKLWKGPQEPLTPFRFHLLSPSSRQYMAHFSSNSSGDTSHRGFGDDGKPTLESEERRRTLNRILYRSRQRGYLELDLLLGKWVEQNIHQLDDENLKALIEVLDLENPYLWKWLTGQEPPPSVLSSNPVFRAIHEEIMGNLNAHAPAETRTKPGQPWVRGWDDNRRTGGPLLGNQ